MRSIALCWICPKEDPEQTLLYRSSEEEWQACPVKRAPFPSSEYTLQRASLSGLKPGTRYRFRIGGEKRERSFRTMPETLEHPLLLIVGGDLYQSTGELLQETNREAAKADPDLVLLGGDLAYSKKKGRQEVRRWIEFLARWSEDLVASDGRMIPLLASTSNEDTSGSYGQTPSEAPYFYALFVPPNGKGYRVVDFGAYMSLWILDSQHTSPISGRQSKWLGKTLEKRREVPFKFALYHVPAYPCVRSPSKRVSKLIRRHWSPLFERGRLTAAFEHHDHAYKRTALIRGRRRSEKGVLYLGDGGWGVKRPRRPKRRWYLEKTASKRHFIKTRLEPDGSCLFEAVSSKGELFDRFLLTPP